MVLTCGFSIRTGGSGVTTAQRLVWTPARGPLGVKRNMCFRTAWYFFFKNVWSGTWLLNRISLLHLASWVLEFPRMDALVDPGNVGIRRYQILYEKIRNWLEYVGSHQWNRLISPYSQCFRLLRAALNHSAVHLLRWQPLGQEALPGHCLFASLCISVISIVFFSPPGNWVSLRWYYLIGTMCWAGAFSSSARTPRSALCALAVADTLAWETHT